MSRARVWLGVLVLVSGCRIEPRAPSDAAGAADARRTASPETTVVARVVPAPGPSGLVIPVAGIGPGDLVDTFDDARSEGRVHDAIDIPAPRGTPVVAAAAGTVARVFESERGGLTVYVLLPDRRTVHYYAHLDAVAPGIDAGATVRQAGNVGTVGSTGNASPEAPHLHFAVWRAPSAEAFWDGEAANPYPLLSGR